MSKIKQTNNTSVMNPFYKFVTKEQALTYATINSLDNIDEAKELYSAYVATSESNKINDEKTRLNNALNSTACSNVICLSNKAERYDFYEELENTSVTELVKENVQDFVKDGIELWNCLFGK